MPTGAVVNFKVDTKHEKYNEMCPIWEVMDDTLAGPYAVKKAGMKYLPMLNWKKSAAAKYKAYRMRAVFQNATRRTANGLYGLVMRKPIRVQPEGIKEEPWYQRISDTGVSYDQFISQMFKMQVGYGRVGILVDAEPGMDTKDPFIYQTLYHANNIINWAPTKVRGQKTLGMVVLREYEEEPGLDPFQPNCVEKFRAIQLHKGPLPEMFASQGLTLENGEEHFVTHTVFSQLMQKQGFVIEEGPYVPHRRKTALSRIPFYIINVTSIEFDEIEEPPLYDLAEINLSQYRSSADLEHGRHFTGLPQPYIFGLTSNEEDSFEIGSESAWVSNNPETKAGFVEFQGQGLRSLENAIQEKHEAMIAQGARLLEQSPTSTRETATGSKIRQSSQSSVLAAMASTGGLGASKAMARQRWWIVGSGALDEFEKETKVCLNADYNDLAMDGEEATKWAELQMKGKISSHVLYHVLDRGEVYPNGWTQEKEEEAIKEDDKDREPTPIAPNPMSVATKPVAAKPVTLNAA